MAGPASEVLISAPGAGLGHLVRACALAHCLRRRQVPVRILTQSLHCQPLAAATGLRIDRIPALGWPGQVSSYVARLRPALIVVDSFPFGIRGEWRDAPADWRFVHLARRLKLAAYEQVCPAAWSQAPPLRRTLALEPLSAQHSERLQAAAEVWCELPARICLPPTVCAPPDPVLVRQLQARPTWLVVHSGPEQELTLLIEKARQEMAADEALMAITPWAVADQAAMEPCLACFPAAALYPWARGVVTGAGYNSCAEAAASPVPHAMFAFERRYDDQAARLAEAWLPASGATDQAAEFICAALD